MVVVRGLGSVMDLAAIVTPGEFQSSGNLLTISIIACVKISLRSRFLPFNTMCDAEPSQIAPSTPSNSAPSTYNAPYDPAYYTWSLFFRGLTGQATDTDIKKYLHNRSLVKEEQDCTQCEKWRDWLFQYSPVVNFLKGNIEKLGGELNEKNVMCRRCDTMNASGIKQGAFAGDQGILLCANHVRDRKSMEDVLAHEMVHAYDFMRFKYDKWNLKHAACTEVWFKKG